jgi:diadenosine tetraphosphatase ApaH/serine/threonine PP2A family protein phosphatase
MQYAVLSDVHANLEALVSVFRDMERKKIGDILFLGDAVGYGPNPDECIELLAARCKILLPGNHDWGATGLTDMHYFNEYARYALEWTKGVLSAKHREILRSLPVKREIPDHGMLLVHATPLEPEQWHYLLTLQDAELNFGHFDQQFCFLGHSHQPFIIEKVPSGELLTHKDAAQMKESSRYIVNTGSVGQPRDGDPRACYVIIDDQGIEIVRVPYDIVSVQEKMKREHLPHMLVERLSIGR